MFINATGFYVPEERVDNQHFLELSGLTSEWIEQRTGIHTRSKAKEGENINTMSLEAVKDVGGYGEILFQYMTYGPNCLTISRR